MTQVDKVERYYIQFTCSNGRTRYCGPDGHMPYERAAAELYTTPDEAFARMEQIPRTHLMRRTVPELKARKVLIAASAPPPPPMWALPGLRTHG